MKNESKPSTVKDKNEMRARAMRAALKEKSRIDLLKKQGKIK